MKTVGCANGHTGRFQPLVHPVLAIITLDHFSGLGIPLGSSPGAGRNAGFASDTQGRIHRYDPVFRAFLHGTCGTGRDTPRIFAVKTGHKYIRRTGKPSDKFRADLDDLTNPGAQWKRLIAFACNFTGMASNALFGILKKKVFTHYDPPNMKKTALLCSMACYAALTLTNVS
jgi:hypothetical protein